MDDNQYQCVSNELLDLNDDCNDVVIALADIHPNWDKLATRLKIPNHNIAEINAKYPKPDPFRQMSDLISTWMKIPTRQIYPSWRVLCQAIAAMGEIGVADKIAASHLEEIHNQPSIASKSANSSTVGTVVLHMKPTLEDLQVQLRSLIDWELFATHLHGIDDRDATTRRISKDCSGTEQQKLALYRVWLDECEDPSWNYIISALKTIKQNRIAVEIEKWLKTKGEKAHILPTNTTAIKTTNCSVHVPEAYGQANKLEVHNELKPILPTETTAIESTDNGHIPQAEGLDIDWELPSNDTAISPITIDDPNYVPKGTVTWHSTSQGNTAKGGGNQQRHLVVAFTNEYKGCTRENGRLDGIKEDRKQLYKTFGGEECRLLKSEDSTKQEMKKTLRMTIEVLQQQQHLQYKSVFIIFSGHGGMTKHKNPFIVSEDGKRVNLDKFIRSFEERIEDDVPKFFLIDACRNVVKRELPKGGAGVNTFHAYATQEGATAWMDEKGSYWIQKVAKLLGSRSGTVVKIIQKANEKVAKEKITQKPIIKVNTLNDEGKDLCLGIDYESSDEEA